MFQKFVGPIGEDGVGPNWPFPRLGFQDNEGRHYHYLGILNMCTRPHLLSMQLGTAVTLPRDIDADLDHWLEPFLAVTGRSTRRKIEPLYVRGLLGSGGRKSVQPMAERLGLSSHDQLHHFISSPAWDDAPLWGVLGDRSTDRSAAREPCWWSMTQACPRRANSRSGWRGN